MQHIQFATKASSAAERSRQWCAATGSAGVVLGDDREASIRGTDLGNVRICTVATGRHRMASEGRQPAPLVKLVFQEEGECRFEQDGRAVLLGPGRWCAYDKARPYRIESRGRSRQTAVSLPAVAFAPATALAVEHSFLTGAGSVLHASITAAVAAAGTLTESHAVQLGDVFLRLLEVACAGEEGVPQPASPREARRAAVIAHVERHLDDPALGLGSIAAALGCSKRTLHKMFADGGPSLGRTIWGRRLDRCRTELIDPAASDRTITDIAFRWGFSDSQHFSRLFKERFGQCPRDFRGVHRAN